MSTTNARAKDDALAAQKRREKERRIKTELTKLKKKCKAIPAEKIAIATDLMMQAARLKVQLDEYEIDIAESGYVDFFKQGENLPGYERARPVVQLRDTAQKTYAMIMKQLTGLMPNAEPDAPMDTTGETEKLRDALTRRRAGGDGE